MTILRNEFLAGKGVKMPKATSTGTTIVGCLFKDGIVLGADTRATEGDIVADKNCEKVGTFADGCIMNASSRTRLYCYFASDSLHCSSYSLLRCWNCSRHRVYHRIDLVQYRASRIEHGSEGTGGHSYDNAETNALSACDTTRVSGVGIDIYIAGTRGI